MNDNTSTPEPAADHQPVAAMEYTLTIQPVTLDGLELDMPVEHYDLDLFAALELAHDEMRRERLAGATITVEGEGSDYRWLVTHPDGEGARFTITYQDRCPKCEDIGGNPGCAACAPPPDE